MARNKIIKIFIFSAFSIFFLFSGKIVWASCPPGCGAEIPIGSYECRDCASGKPLGTFRGLGPLSDFIDGITRTNPDKAISTFSNFISTIVGVLTVVAFIWFIFNLFIAAIAWLSSGGDKAKLQEAQKKITTNLVGLVIVVSAIFLTKIIGVVFGIDILAIQNLIKNLQ